MRFSIKSKILLSTALVVSIALFANGVFAYHYFRSVLKSQVIRDNTAKMDQTGNQLLYFQEDISKFCKFIIIDNEIQSLIQKSYKQNIFDSFSSRDKISRKLANYICLREYISSAFFVTASGDVFSNSTNYDGNYRDTLNQSWYLNFKSRKINSGFSDPHTETVSQRPGPVISYIVQVNNIEDTGKVFGKLIVNIDLNYIAQFLETACTQYDDFVLLNGSNALLFGKGSYPDYREISGITEEGIFENENSIGIFENSLDDGWKLISATSKSRIFSQIRFIYYFFILSAAASLALIILILLPVVKSITKPVVKLTNAVRAVSGGNLDTFVSIKSGDEIEILSAGFNNMLQDLKKHIHQSLENEKIKRRLETDLLISQINPHFICNTLNMISYMARNAGNTDIVTMVKSFIYILQDTIRVKKDESFTSVRKEIDIVNHYVIIQKYRYPGKFELTWDIGSEDIPDYLIPKTLLQPLVENALFHGICPGDGPGTINISIYTQSEQLVIIVEDNGVGMTDLMIECLMNGQEPENSASRMRSIGFGNVRDRISYLFGQKYGVEIESHINSGTKVILRIPIIQSNSLNKYI